ncbi:hypothetical protein PVAG01_07880 [Phlyctema vagabunda]|uniref:Cellobiose dehydrogenase-like cytochrome domain-containing protein n=1 Tax=Phlyctema vagabunda TaxID=108571 RepID=A0ABR4PDN9_9HELO
MLYLLSLLILILHLAQASPHYVERADLLIDISLVQNSSSNAVDFHISMTSKFGPKGGWVALGTGHGMKGSLMFIMFPTDEKCDTSPQYSVSFSVQKASGHAQPKPSPELPAISVLNSLSTDSNGARVEFICYSCDQWPEMDVASSAQQFIWAKREARVVSETILGIHSDLGFLEFDMKQAFTDSIDPSHSNPLAEPVAEDVESDTTRYYIRTLHGVVLGASFMALYPIGAVIIHHSSFKDAFTYHWTFQLSLTAACLVTVILGLAFSGNGVKILMGYLHHLNYRQLMRRTWVSYGHIWLGKLVLALGIVNTKLGLDYFGAQKKALLLWWMCLGLYVSCLLYIVVRQAMNNKTKAGGAGYTLLNV